MMKQKTINILIVDDQEYHNSMLSNIFKSDRRLVIVGTAINDREMSHILSSVHVDLILLDVELPRSKSKDGIRIAQELKKTASRFKNLKILCLSMNTQSHVLRSLIIDIGVEGYLDKNESNFDDITNAIIQVIEGNSFPVLSLGLRKKVDRMRSGRNLDQGITNLTKREKEILPHIAGGLTNDEISSELTRVQQKRVSEKTIGKHRENIYQKLECNNAAQVSKVYFNFTRLHGDSEDELPQFKSI